MLKMSKIMEEHTDDARRSLLPQSFGQPCDTLEVPLEFLPRAGAGPLRQAAQLRP
jgi:hypothetical protein